tara:strand:- start:51 stop:242 length:192 start_codon:yes stop_codon:yes gene_type:complete
MTADTVGRLRNVRRNLTAVLLNLPIKPNETTVATLLVMLDHFADNPDEYYELLNVYNNQNSRL